MLGIDVGTTGCKVGVYRVDGKRLALASRRYGVDVTRLGWAEQDPLVVLDAMVESVRQIDACLRADVVVAALSVQGEALIFVDGPGRPVRPAILGMDRRAIVEARELLSGRERHWLYERTGQPVSPLYPLAKWIWLSRHEPETLRRASGVRFYEDFIGETLTGRAVVSASLASRTQWASLEPGQWDGEILDAFGVDDTKLSAVQEGGRVVGPILPAWALRLGVGMGTMLASGGHDQACAALGTGLVDEGDVLLSTGTAEVVMRASRTPVLREDWEEHLISTYRHARSGRYLVLGLNHTAGAVVEWLVRQLGSRDVDDAYGPLMEMVARQPGRIFAVPRFLGLDEGRGAATGAFFGLDLGVGKGDLLRAVIEGLGYEVRRLVECMALGQESVGRVVQVGGGAKSNIWTEIKADILGVEIHRTEDTEAALLGAARLGAEAVGLEMASLQTPESAVGDTAVAPVAAYAALHARRYAKYRELLRRVALIERDLA